MSNYQVLFNGVTLDGDDPTSVERVERALAGELGIDHSKAKRLFSGRTVVLASQLSREEALDLQARLEQVGAVARIKDMSPKAELPPDYEREREAGAFDATLRDLTAAHVECPRCGHMQLESSHCTRCGVDIEALFRKRRKEDLLMEKQLRDHRQSVADKALAGAVADHAVDAHGEPVANDQAGDTSAPIQRENGGFFSRLFGR